MASNCLSLIPVETDWGRKRQIEQSSCNKDYSCAERLLPELRQRRGRGAERSASGQASARRRSSSEIAAITAPPAWAWSGPFDLLVTGVGGTGVVTVGALVTMAAHLEGKQASVLDFMGFAQKGGAVLSFVRLAPSADPLNQVRIDTQQADLLLACDMVVGASNEALGTVKHGRTRRHRQHARDWPRRPSCATPMRHCTHRRCSPSCATPPAPSACPRPDAQAIAQRLLGDTLPANIVMLGVAFQRGLVPVS